MSLDQHDLDVAAQIGAMQTSLAHYSNTHTVILDKLTKIDEKLTIQNGSIAKAHARIDEVTPAMAAANDYLENKRKVKWVLTGASIAGLGGGFTVNGIIEKLRDLLSGG